MTYKGKPPERCSFCGKDSRHIRKLFSGHDAYICDECVDLTYELLQDDIPTKAPLPPLKLFKPKETKAFLDQYVIGQEQAKKTLSVAVYNHYQRLFHPEAMADVELEKSNILLLGATGTGKTLLARTLARMLSVPFCITDATVLTEAGYVGEDVENILVKLYHAADYNKDRTETGIIFVDELDKLSRRSANPSITRDVSGEGVQQGLLKILEGTVSSIPPKGGRKHPEQPLVPINTSNILFICGGAFNGLEEIIMRRIGRKRLGFGVDHRALEFKDSGEIFKHVEPPDLLEYGLIPELVGRLPVITALGELSDEAMLRILTEPKNSLVKQYQKMFALEGIELEFTPEALTAVVDLARKRKTGARALRSIFEEKMLDIMYDAPSYRNVAGITITADIITADAAPIIKRAAKGKRQSA
ncbi:MAG: ATP-dependent Clp protease ATP-binding subunit ClpX [candidate division Zixibacteria bacterium]|nr:ATP-dependent Clp protease ATP-binding subunit ClpX [candidate division Zixibacteria bacterium]